MQADVAKIQERKSNLKGWGKESKFVEEYTTLFKRHVDRPLAKPMLNHVTFPFVCCVFLLLPELSFAELQWYLAFFVSCTIRGCPCITLEYVCLCEDEVHRI